MIYYIIAYCTVRTCVHVLVYCLSVNIPLMQGYGTIILRMII